MDGVTPSISFHKFNNFGHGQRGRALGINNLILERLAGQHQLLQVESSSEKDDSLLVRKRSFVRIPFFKGLAARLTSIEPAVCNEGRGLPTRM